MSYDVRRVDRSYTHQTYTFIPIHEDFQEIIILLLSYILYYYNALNSEVHT